MAFHIAADQVEGDENEEIKISFPVGLLPDNTTIPAEATYSKDELLERYRFLAYNQLALHGVYHLVTIVESMLHDVIRKIVIRIPRKLKGGRQVPLEMVLQASSIEEVHLRAVDAPINK